MSIRIVAIAGSVRKDNYTMKALNLVVDEIRKHKDITLDVIDPAAIDLALPGRPATADAAKLQQLVKEATGIILATPEYHGSFSSMMKLIIENLGFPSVLAGKPVALLGVAAGAIGAIKSLEHLRSICSHTGALVLPGLVSVANVQKAFDAGGKMLDAGTEARIRSVATSLIDYIHGSICPRFVLEEMIRKGS
jgi:FMN reductase